eukprot:342708-Hanusia_phi.AAC.1
MCEERRVRDEMAGDGIGLDETICLLTENNIYRPQFEPSETLIILHATEEPKKAESYDEYSDELNEILGKRLCSTMKEWPRELASRSLGPVTKPVARLLQKLNATKITFLVCGNAASVTVMKIIANEVCRESISGVIFFVHDAFVVPAQIKQQLITAQKLSIKAIVISPVFPSTKRSCSSILSSPVVSDDIEHFDQCTSGISRFGANERILGSLDEQRVMLSDK